MPTGIPGKSTKRGVALKLVLFDAAGVYQPGMSFHFMKYRVVCSVILFSFFWKFCLLSVPEYYKKFDLFSENFYIRYQNNRIFFSDL